METKFKIAKYLNEDGLLTKVGYTEYNVTYLKGTKVHQLRIVVNGYLTKETINLVSFHDGYKNKILLAIKEYHETQLTNKNKVIKKVSLNYIKQYYSRNIVKNVENYLVAISKEESRDKLTKFGLIN